MKGRRYFIPKGLSTTGYSGGTPEEFDRFQDVETDHGGFEIRGGMVRLASVADSRGILDFDGVDDRVDLPASSPLSSLGTIWTVGALFVVDDLSSLRTIIAKYGAATIGLQVNVGTLGTVNVVFRDTAGNTTQLTSAAQSAGATIALTAYRSGDSVGIIVNGTTTTGTMSSATNLMDTGRVSLGTNNGANWLDGGIDFVRAWNVVRTTQQDAHRRLQNPRVASVLCDYVLNQGTANTPDVHDRSAYGLHADVQGTPTWAKTPLSNSAPIQGIGYSVRRNGTREIVFMSAGRPYTATVT